MNGPRQAGKSELLRMLEQEVGGDLLTLDRPAHLRLARTDPTGFLADRARPTYIDEVQRGGDPLVLAIKVLLDESQARGQVVLAGSTRFLAEPRLSESLAGRVRFVDLWPLSQGEIEQGGESADGFVDSVFRTTAEFRERAATAPATGRRELYERLCVGGFPEAVTATSPRARDDFFADYIRTISQRDIAELSRLAQRVDLPQVLRMLAERTATITNRAKLARAVGMSEDAMRRYLPLVETIFLTFELGAYAGSSAARTRRRPKLHITDTGLAASLLGLDAQRLLSPDATRVGQLLETFVVMEIVKQLGWSDQRVSLSHYRSEDDREVDLLMETPDGRLVGIEVKAAIDVDDRDFGHLAHIRDRFGDRFVNGVVLHCGQTVERWGDRLTSAPVSALWSASDR